MSVEDFEREAAAAKSLHHPHGPPDPRWLDPEGRCVLCALATIRGYDPAGRQLVDGIRAIAREEIASMAGLVLRRMQEIVKRDFAEADDPETAGADGYVEVRDVNEIFGEILRDYGSTDAEPGEPS